MIRLALRTLRLRTGGFVAAFIALLFGATIVMACGGLMETGIRTAIPAQRLVDAPIVVTGDQSSGAKGTGEDLPERVRIDADLLGRIQATPGVAAAVPDVSFPATVLHNGKPGAPSTGHGWDSTRLAPYTLTAGTAPSAADDVVADANLGLKVGDEVQLAVAGGARNFHVVGLIAANSYSSTMFFTDTEADTLLGSPGKIDSIGVLTTPGTDVDALSQQLANVLKGHNAVALTGDDRGQAEIAGAVNGGDNLVALAGVFGGLGIAIAIFVVGATLGLSIQQRQRELALLRAVGGTPGQVRRMIMVEVFAVAVLATGLAYFPGQAAGRWLTRQMGANGVISPAIQFHQGWIPTVSAVGIGLLTAILAGFIAANRAAKAKPSEALAEAALPTHWVSWFRVTAALACFGGGTALAIVTATVMAGPVAASTAGPSAILWACAFALVGPGLFRLCTAVFRWPLRLFTGLAGYLAVLNAKAAKIRLASAVVPIMLASGMAIAMVYLQTTSVADAEDAYAAGLRADAVVASATGGMPLNFVDTVRHTPGVAAASAFASTTGYLTEAGEHDDPDVEDYPIQGVSADAAAQTTATNVAKGSLTDLTGNTIALPTDVAADYSVTLGQTLPIRLGDGTLVSPRVVALLTEQRGSDTILMPADLVVAHLTNGLLPQILVTAAPGTSTAQLTANLTALAATQPGLVVEDRSALAAQFGDQQQTSEWINYLLVAMIVGYAVIALINTLVMATNRRKGEFALHRLVGSTNRQVLRMMSVESLLVALTGLVLGTAIGAAVLVPFGLAAGGSMMPRGPWWVFFAVAAGSILLSLGATLGPTLAALRTPAIAAVASGD
ncbi:MAG TPA: FtsX-like permease family protein [Pseudonocardiaceae bacterium]|nr:FtsX-like permease family protein [Pseudonocardiaceae bacterium]